MRSVLSISVVATGLLLVGPAVSAGQQPPPIGGVTGTIALEGTVEKTYERQPGRLARIEDGVDPLRLLSLTVRDASCAFLHEGPEAQHECQRLRAASPAMARIRCTGMNTSECFCTLA
jgi:hypothetical protein